jgi:drug/metabolite transporter (DMT)-like permease
VQRWVRNLPWIVVSGVFLGLHFATWVWSLDHTSLAHSLTFVTMYPILLNWGHWVLFGLASCSVVHRSVERPAWLETAGTLVSLLGAFVMLADAFAESDTGGRPS